MFLELAYGRFLKLFDEIMGDAFWLQSDYYRFSKVVNGFSVYAELLNYEPIKWVIEEIKQNRPPMEAEIGSDLFKFIRNLVTHFPVFERWDDVWCSELLVNWERKGTIDKFLRAYSGKPEVKYRFWNPKKNEMTYLSIRFPSRYSREEKILLRDIVTEKDGIRFCFVLMNQILSSQVESIKNS